MTTGQIEAAPAALDLYTNKSGETGCANPSNSRYLRSSDGQIALLRCGLNGCLFCYRLKCFERAQMIYLDALVEAPTYAFTLTTRSPVWDGERYSEGRAQVMRALRREYGAAESIDLMEQTQGTAPRSGGHKRGHGHALSKKLPPGQVLELERLIVPIWKRCLGAWQVNISEIGSAGGAVAYLTLNLGLEKSKASQAPLDLPKGTRTLRATRGYWSRPVDELRAEAREHNALRRFEHVLRLAQPLEVALVPGFVDESLAAERLARASRSWEVRLGFNHPWRGWQDRGPSSGSLTAAELSTIGEGL